MSIVFPYQPQAPVSETIEYLTDLAKSNNGTEDTLRLRNNPRRIFKCSFPARDDIKSTALDILSAGARTNLYFPIWTEAFRIGAVGVGTSISFDTTRYNYGQFAIIWQSDTDWQLMTIDTVSAGSITFVETTTAMPDAWVMPIRTAYFPTGFRKVGSGLDAVYDLDFKIIDNYSKVPSALPQYLSDDLFLREFETLRTGKATVEEDSFLEMKVFDSQTGLVSTTVDLTDVRTARNMSFFNSTEEEFDEMMDFLYSRSGRASVFWQPSFDTDLVSINTGTIASIINVKANQILARDDKRNHIGVQTKDGTWYVRQIDSFVIVDPETIGINFTGNLDIAADSIKRISWVGKRRLDTDSVTITHQTGGITTASFRTVEIEV